MAGCKTGHYFFAYKQSSIAVVKTKQEKASHVNACYVPGVWQMYQLAAHR